MSLTSTVHASGHFHVKPAQWTSHHCGIDGRTIRFNVAVSGELDARGFVIDVRDVHEYFRQKYVLGKGQILSCEMIAQEAIEHFRKVGHKVNGASADIQATKKGYATCQWKA